MATEKFSLRPARAFMDASFASLSTNTRINYFEPDIRIDAIESNGTDVALYAIPTQPTLPPGSAGMQDVQPNQYSDFISWAPRNIGAFYFHKNTWMCTTGIPNGSSQFPSPASQLTLCRE